MTAVRGECGLKEGSVSNDEIKELFGVIDADQVRYTAKIPKKTSARIAFVLNFFFENWFDSRGRSTPRSCRSC
eukprot:COSAG05_NODE_6928_length_880_cov_1.524968_2_plen_73_part_00